MRTRRSSKPTARPVTATRQRPSWDRRANPERRAELVARAADFLLDQGLVSFTLRRAAEAAGTSAQLLVHHFGTKEQLIDEAVAAVTRRQLGDLFAGEMSPADFDEAFWSRWTRLTSPEYLRFLALSYELLTASIRAPQRFKRVWQDVFAPWHESFAASLTKVGVAPDRAARMTNLYAAALRSLLLDLLVTGDRQRVDAAAKLMAEDLQRDLGAALSTPPGPLKERAKLAKRPFRQKNRGQKILS